MDKSQNKVTGNAGEDQAVDFLISKKYKIIGRNISYPFGEIDILARDQNGSIVIVEVKTVRGTGYGSAEDLVRYRKKQKLLLLSKAVSQNYPRSDIRIDIVAINFKKITHIINAVN